MTGVLQDVAFFADFPAAAIARLESVSSVRKYKKNHHLIISGDECHSAYVLMSGNVHAYMDDESGNEFIINSFRKGDLFGELGVLDGLSRTANVVTTSATECLVIPKAELLRVINDDTKVAAAVIRSLVGRIRGMTEDVSCLALMDVYGRLARTLQAESTPTDDGLRITERLTHEEIGKKVGSSREMISKILKDLRVGGYIEVKDRRILILKDLPERW